MPYAKPRTPRIYQTAGAPSYWALMGGPSRTHAADIGDVADLTGITPAAIRGGNATWVPGPRGNRLLFNGSGNAVCAPVIPASVTFTCRATYIGTAPGMVFALKSGSPGPALYFTTGLIAWNTFDGPANSFAPIPASAKDGSSHYYAVIVSPALTALYYDGLQIGTCTYKDPTSNYRSDRRSPGCRQWLGRRYRRFPRLPSRSVVGRDCPRRGRSLLAAPGAVADRPNRGSADLAPDDRDNRPPRTMGPHLLPQDQPIIAG